MKHVQDERNYHQIFKPSPAMTERTRRRARYIMEAGNVTPGMHVLEIGCGHGDMLYEIASACKAYCTGIDRSPRFIAEARRKHARPGLPIAFEVMDFMENPPDARTFDYIYGNGILHHLMPDVTGALIRIRRFLSPQGRICFLEPNLFNPYIYCIFSYNALRRAAKLEPQEMAFTHRTIIPALKDSGFTAIKVEYKDFLLPNTPSFLIRPLIALGDLAERTPLAYMAQSLFISASA